MVVMVKEGVESNTRLDTTEMLRICFKNNIKLYIIMFLLFFISMA